MKKPPIRTTAMALAVPLLAWQLLANAQDPPPAKKPSEPGAKKNDSSSLPPAYRTFATRPDLHYAAEVRFKLPGGQERVLYVVPQNKGSDLFVKGLFFYTPALVLAENEKPIEGFPAVVQEAEPQPDKSTFLGFKAILNSDALSQHARDAILQQPQARALWTKEGMKEDDIQVKPWPVVHAIIALVDLRDDNSPLAVTQSEIRGGSSVDFGFRLTDQELSAVQSLANKGRLGLVYSYSFVGKGQDYGEIDLEAVKTLKVSLKNKLSSEQLEGKAPIFQAEANEAARYTALMIRRTGRSNNPNTLALINTPSLMQQLFAPDGEITLDNLKKGDEERAKRIADYLTPQVEQLRQAMRAEQAARKTDEKTDFEHTKNGSSINVGGGISIYGIGLNFGVGDSSEHTKGKEFKKRLEVMTGSEWQVEKDERKLIPHKIFAYKFVQGSDQTLLTDRSAMYIAVDKENYYYQDKAISIAFTDKVLGKIKPNSGGILAGYDGVPLGAMVPFFGVKPPKGYRRCNGNDSRDYPRGDNVYPHADWVPKHLVGMPLPDMRHHLVGGAGDESDIGQVWNAGKIPLKEVKVDFTKVVLPPERVETLQTAPGTTSPPVIAGDESRKLAYGGTAIPPKQSNLSVAPFDYKVYRSGRAATGSQSFPAYSVLLNDSTTNPRHVMCQWIIRVE